MMQNLVRDLIDVIDQYKDQPEQLEVKVKEIYESHKSEFTTLSETINENLQKAMKEVDPTNFEAVMNVMFETVGAVMGAENFQRMMTLQQSHPHLNKVMKEIIPIKK